MAQAELPYESDPFIDPLAIENTTGGINKRFTEESGFMVGLMYGLNPVILFSPAISISYFHEEFVIGVESSNSDLIGVWTKQRLEQLGTTRFRGNTLFIKYFFGSHSYIMGAYEYREAILWNRNYDRPPTGGKSRWDIFTESNVGSLGLGYMRIGKLGFMSLDIIRYSVLLNNKFRIKEYWETWTEKGDRDQLDNNMNYVRDDWYDVLDSPSAVLITVGFYF